jgi:hypothetical protein
MIGQHALWITGRSRGVAERRCRTLVKGGIDRGIFVIGIDKCLVGNDAIGKIGSKFVWRAHRDVEPKRMLPCNDTGERLVFEVVEQPNIFGVFSNIDDLFGEKPRVDG